MKVSVVIPNWKGRKLLERNLPAVLGIGADEVIVVDDASPDESSEFIKKHFKEVKLIQHKKNRGFAQAANTGVAYSNGDIILLLNPDVRPRPGLIEKVLLHFQDEQVFGVSFAESKWSWARGFWKDGFVEHEPGKRTKEAHPTFWVSGGSGAFRKSIWNKLGGMDKIFAPFYWEDIDLSYRAAKRGYKLLWEPEARVLHKHEAIISKNFPKSYIDFIWQRNQLIFIWKNITSARLIRQHLTSLVLRLIKSPGYLKVIFAALVKLPVVLGKRIKEVRAAKVSDEAIFARFKS